MRREFLAFAFLSTAIILLASYFHSLKWLWTFTVIGPINLLGIYEMVQTKHTLMSNYPILGRGRYIMEWARPKIHQYFVETDTDGTPINRIVRSVVYQRAKKDRSTTPFGTQLNVYDAGYEWINHSMSPLDIHSIRADDLRVTIGGPECQKPYSCSLFNISAMSYGALSRTAIEALNWGAKIGNFAHNTGEGGISPFHLKHGGDLIWQIGTGYFGCRTEDGNFDPKKFKERSTLDNVKMIEIKLSQGAKPGHGGILPAPKNTPEIAAIRGLQPWTTVESPGNHKAFSGPHGFLQFVQQLRELSGGKPVGFKFCFGKRSDFRALCEAMEETKILPDYIAVDGGEGGTGAAPLEFSNSIGTPLREGIVYVHDFLSSYGLRDKIKIFAAGKILTGFDIVKAIALGADACYTARGMMLALGCIQALECNSNACPTGVATQSPHLYKGLVPEDKYKRVANYHQETLNSVAEMLAATGFSHTSALRRNHIWRRVGPTEVKNYKELYPYTDHRKRV